MTLSSSRLIYTKITESDFEEYYSWYSDGKLMKYITGKALTLPETRARFQNVLKINAEQTEGGLFMVYFKDSGEFMGIVRFTFMDEDQVEVGYGLKPEYWGQKYATEMLLCLMEYAGTIPRIRSLVGVVNPDNAASIKVLTNQGFTFWKTENENGKISGFYKLEV